MKLAIETLDRSRPFGEVCGQTDHNIAFAQKGLGIESWPYDHQGKLIEAALNDAQRAKLAQKRAAAETRAQAQQAVAVAEQAPAQTVGTQALAAAQADEEPDDDEIEDIGEKPVEEKADDDEVNLVTWLKTGTGYKAFEIQRAIKARYGANKPGFAQAALFLVDDKKLLPWAEVAENLRPAHPAA
jgi:hypothetical protein